MAESRMCYRSCDVSEKCILVTWDQQSDKSVKDKLNCWENTFSDYLKRWIWEIVACWHVKTIFAKPNIQRHLNSALSAANISFETLDSWNCQLNVISVEYFGEANLWWKQNKLINPIQFKRVSVQACLESQIPGCCCNQWLISSFWYIKPWVCNYQTDSTFHNGAKLVHTLSRQVATAPPMLVSGDLTSNSRRPNTK